MASLTKYLAIVHHDQKAFSFRTGWVWAGGTLLQARVNALVKTAV